MRWPLLINLINNVASLNIENGSKLLSYSARVYESSISSLTKLSPFHHFSLIVPIFSTQSVLFRSVSLIQVLWSWEHLLDQYQKQN